MGLFPFKQTLEELQQRYQNIEYLVFNDEVIVAFLGTILLPGITSGDEGEGQPARIRKRRCRQRRRELRVARVRNRKDGRSRGRSYCRGRREERGGSVEEDSGIGGRGGDETESVVGDNKEVLGLEGVCVSAHGEDCTSFHH